MYAMFAAVLISMLLSVVTFGRGLPCTHTTTSLRCVEYVGNHDGDTITFNIRRVHPILGDRISVRVLGLDTPELSTADACEKAAAIKARELVRVKLKSAKRIDLNNIGRDKYFRIDADVLLDRKNLREVIEASGLSVPYTGGTKLKKDWCK